MTASSAPSAHPAYALLCWIDDKNIYIEVPTKLGQPLISKYPINEQGLSKALNFLRVRRDEAPSDQKNYTQTQQKWGKGDPKVQTQDQRAAALAVLRKLGMV